VAGLGLTILAALALRGFLVDVDPSDPRLVLPVLAILTLVGVVASVLPARRAGSVLPATALREE
jgi:ABC-type lipoprotein release transport system permease subunit